MLCCCFDTLPARWPYVGDVHHTCITTIKAIPRPGHVVNVWLSRRYVLWEDGTQQWENLPQGLHHCVNGRKKSLPQVLSMSCGPAGEWFVRFLDGSYVANGLCDDLSKTIDCERSNGDFVIHIGFGIDGSWVLVHG